jgi:import receptor subunit TOM70
LIGRIEEARSDFTKAVDLSSNYPIAYVQKLYADYKYYAFVKGDTRKADETLDHFKEAMEKYPNCVECYSLYAQVSFLY